jgi:2-keto-4-pentenoate hydratase/2-oxohepta-3-ene-1,7-dioic acid hydratase in catechol pathway
LIFSGERPPWEAAEGARAGGPEARRADFDEVTLLAPASPTKIVAVGLNYRDHAAEMGAPLPEEPLIFLKPPSAVIGPEEDIVLPPSAERVDYEGELAVVIGRRVKDAGPGEARAAIFGYTCLNDVTARDLQARDGQWSRAKGFDTFACVGPAVATGIDPSDLSIETWLNGRRAQASRTSQLIFDVAALVSFVSRVMTLEPGDLLSTGTPAGVGPLAAGDVVEIRIEGIGTLRNPVRKA